MAVRRRGLEAHAGRDAPRARFRALGCGRRGSARSARRDRGFARAPAPAGRRGRAMSAVRSVSLALALAALLVIGAACTTSGGGAVGSGTALGTPQIASLVASPDRSAADRRNDERRKP